MGLEHRSYESILKNLHDGLYFVDKNRTITYWNRAAERISGFAAEEVVGKSCSDNILTHVNEAGESLCTGMCPLAATIKDGKAREAEVFMHNKSGHRVPVSVRVSTLKDDAGNIIGGIELFTDISSLSANEIRIRELEKLAFVDKLTQLANRSYVEKNLSDRFAELKDLKIPFGILFMDIDHFKRFNDTYGHDVGDQVLIYTGKTFTANSRPFDLYGRWGGEEFIGIIRNTDEKELKEVAERVRILVANSYIVCNDEKLNVTISVGATVAREGDTADTLLKRADTMLYASKSSGRNRVSVG